MAKTRTPGITVRRARMRLSREVALHPSHFDLESFLSLLLCYRTDAQADTEAEVSLVNEQPTVREARLADGVSATTINRSLEVVRTILNRAARSYRGDDGRPFTDCAARYLAQSRGKRSPAFESRLPHAKRIPSPSRVHPPGGILK